MCNMILAQTPARRPHFILFSSILARAVRCSPLHHPAYFAKALVEVGFFDLGGFLKAKIAFALERDGLSAEISEFLKNTPGSDQ